MSAVQHIAMNCVDRVAQERFYSQYFGFKRARVFARGEPDEFVMLRLGSVCLEFFDNPAADGDAGGEQAVGFKHLAFEVDDLDAIVDALRKEEVEIGPIVDCSDSVPGLRVCFLKDPEGNILELMQGWQDE